MLFGYELKKLALSPVIIGFVVLCLIVNAMIAITSYNEPGSDAKAEAVDIFKDFQTSEIAEGYIRKYGIAGANAENIRSKYEKLQPVVDEKSANGDALSVYFGKQTHYRHSLLFEMMFMAIIAESCLLALFTALLSVTYEHMRGTEPVIYASAVGRRVLRTKLWASITAAAALSVVIIGVSLLVFFLRFDFSGVWTANVSSMFNYAMNEYGKPFITWRCFTVAGYLWATIGISFGLTLCFCLLGYAVGVSVRSGYGAFVSAASVVGVLFLAKPILPIGSVYRGIWNLTPVWLWKNSGMWFTDGGADLIWANFESMGLFVSLAVLSVAAFMAAKCFERRELY
ncbi:hypothetical protein [Paenibacillus ginsengarvi]|uniref:Uncharacterized protein n=1 Tax=Paenibacillus ginsengarvi TaxID=400777 RepID=A0A3B0C4J6_9BACL|nr:hypothetical protein [Paenibacillus ginsengarvi]RKN80612.1 hypothetical protein D7M11_19205 [Paenibacillus ginsengarvi]